MRSIIQWMCEWKDYLICKSFAWLQMDQYSVPSTFILDIRSKVTFQSIHLHFHGENQNSIEIYSLMVHSTMYTEHNESILMNQNLF